MGIGVLDLQGAVREHVSALRACGCSVRTVKRADDLDGLRGLVIPGGESTTIGKLMVDYGLMDAIRERAALGMSIYGTCAGLVLLAREIQGSSQPRLGLMDMSVCRNAFGRQRESFESPLSIPVMGEEPFPGVFIRAPYVPEAGPACEVLCRYNGRIVLVREGRFLASAFHPELTDDLRLHRYFLSMFDEEGRGRGDVE
ncbi:MAG: pyridoxal 5'-phosphate synthase glutaminase subunit PdxT [Firmicutes bacterium]|nr:pyridoxal 5'-phosphate synthase glutaminase subunit PdxT [Bacillota bacterium]